MEKFKKDKTKHDDNSRYKDSKLSIFPLIESIKIYISKSYRNFKADDNRSFTQSYFSDAVKLLLDTYPNAAAAYSLRKLSTSYQGPAIRVRRSSDNQEQDIYFDSLSNLDTNSLTSFVGIGGNGFVTTWYDQSGNSRNATQSTAASQPKIVNAGNIVSVNSKPALSFDGVDDKLTNTTLPAASTQSVFYVKKGANLSGNSSVLGFPATLVGNQLGIYYFLGPQCYGFNTWNGDSWGYSNSSSDFLNQTLEMGLFLDGNPSLSGVKLFINNSQKTLSQVLSTSLTRTMGDGFRIGQGGDSSNSQDYDGWQQEVIIWSADYSIVNRVEIQNNINQYYSIY